MALCHTTSRQTEPAQRVSQPGQPFVKAGPFLLSTTQQQGQLLHEDFAMPDWLSIVPPTKAEVNQDTTSVNFIRDLDF